MMRAKLQVSKVETFEGATQEYVVFHAVAKSDGYPPDGADEDNTFARWTPSADLKMTITNPALLGKFAVGQKFYVDFSPAE